MKLFNFSHKPVLWGLIFSLVGGLLFAFTGYSITPHELFSSKSDYSSTIVLTFVSGLLVGLSVFISTGLKERALNKLKPRDLKIISYACLAATYFVGATAGYKILEPLKDKIDYRLFNELSGFAGKYSFLVVIATVSGVVAYKNLKSYHTKDNKAEE